MTNEQKDKIQLCSNETILELIKQQKTTLDTYRKTITGLIIAICLIVFGICGTVIYGINTLEMQVEETTTTTTTTTQTVDGEGEIINGNQYKDNAIHNQTKEADK